jgi:hypothetical protein
MQARLDRTDDVARDLILHGEDVAERAVVALGPDMRAGFRLDQLRGDAHARADRAVAALHHVAHAELAADAADVDRASLVGEARVARDHEQPAQPRQVGKDVLHHAVGKIVMARVAAHVDEGQHRDRGPVGQRRQVLVRAPYRAGRGLRRQRAGETVTAPRNGDDIIAAVIGLAERLAQAPDLHLDVVLLDDQPGPDALHQRVLGDELARRRDEDAEHLERAAAERDQTVAAIERPVAQIEPERTERDRARRAPRDRSGIVEVVHPGQTNFTPGVGTSTEERAGTPQPRRTRSSPRQSARCSCSSRNAPNITSPAAFFKVI